MSDYIKQQVEDLIRRGSILVAAPTMFENFRDAGHYAISRFIGHEDTPDFLKPVITFRFVSELGREQRAHHDLLAQHLSQIAGRGIVLRDKDGELNPCETIATYPASAISADSGAILDAELLRLAELSKGAKKERDAEASKDYRMGGR